MASSVQQCGKQGVQIAPGVSLRLPQVFHGLNDGIEAPDRPSLFGKA